MFVLPLPLLRVSYAESSLEDFSNSFKWHTLALGVAEDDEEPAHKADAAIEAKGAAGSDALHLSIVRFVLAKV